MNKNIEHYFFRKENFLDEKYCENCINELNECSWEKHYFYFYKTDLNHDRSGDNEPEILKAERFSFNVNKINGFILDKLHSIILEYIESFKFRDAINTMIDLARLGNKYLAETEPWKLIKTSESKKVETIMNISIQICGILTVVCEPFLPNTSKKLKKQFNLENINWNEINKNTPIISTKIKKSDLIFRKIEDEEIDFQLRKLNASKK